MLCNKCYDSTKVTDSRFKKKSNSVNRRRICINCGYRFSTIETIKEINIIERDYNKLYLDSINKINKLRIRLNQQNNLIQILKIKVKNERK